MAQEPKSQSQREARPEAKGAKPPGKKGRGEAPRDGKNKRTGKGGRRPGGRDRASSNSPLTTGLFSGLADKRLPCKIKGCKETFLWTAQEQLRNFGKPAPQRMCEMHAAQFYDLKDMELPCRNAPACKETWIWKRGAQLHARERQGGDGPLRPPSRLCATCYSKEKELKEQEVECRTQGCSRTWVWSRDAQIRHRAWLRRELAKAQKEEQAEHEPKPDGVEAVGVSAEASPEAPAPSQGPEPSQTEAEAKPEAEVAAKPEAKKRKRRKKSKRLQEGPPERHCKLCADRFAKIVPVELPCKVHGCKSPWVWDRVSQLKAWAALGVDDVQAPVKIPKRMCTGCRDFCKKNSEREVVCAVEGCEETWTFKVGAQLQHVLGTGGIEDPRRLCETCMQAQYKKSKRATGELMPCAKPGCDGTWLYVNGMPLAADDGSEIPPDRLCNACRAELGLEPRAASLDELNADAQGPETKPSEPENNADTKQETEEPVSSGGSSGDDSGSSPT